MTGPVVSIVMAMYNARPFVAEAIESVLRQDYDNFELVIVDDGSTDGGSDTVERFRDPRIRLIRTANRGPSAARNLGIARSVGDYVTFLDSDDLLTTKSISSRVDGLKKSQGECVFSREILVINILERNKPICMPSNRSHQEVGRIWPATDLVEGFIEGRFYAFVHAFLIPRSILQTTGGFDESIKTAEDVEFLTRLLLSCRSIVETFEIFYIYRRRPDSLSAINSRRMAAEKLRALRQAHRNLAPYLCGRETWVAQSLFNYCAEAYPYWTNDHRVAMAEARRLRGDKPFDLAWVGGTRAQAVARLLGWRAGRLWTFASSSLRYWLKGMRAFGPISLHRRFRGVSACTTARAAPSPLDRGGLKAKWPLDSQ